MYKLGRRVVARDLNVKHRASNVLNMKSKDSRQVPQRWRVKAQIGKSHNFKSTVEKKGYKLIIEKSIRKEIKKVDEEKIFIRKMVSFASNLISDIFFRSTW